MAVLEETIDIAVIGAGHAGCEAALAAARMGLETVVFTTRSVARWVKILIRRLFSRKC